jgi:hypothetical protein
MEPFSFLDKPLTVERLEVLVVQVDGLEEMAAAILARASVRVVALSKLGFLSGWAGCSRMA